MGSSEVKTAQQDMQDAIQEAGRALGEAMDKILPHDGPPPSRFAGMRSAHYVRSMSILMPVEKDDGNKYTRAWLARKRTKEPFDSTIHLLKDTVMVSDRLETEDGPRFKVLENPHPIANYGRNNGGFKLEDALGAPQEDVLARIQELGGWVARISDAQLHAAIEEALPRPVIELQ